MPATISLEGREFTLIKEQRSGISLYKSADSYLRIGERTRVEKEIATHRAMEAAGFPIPAFVASGIHEGMAYLIESALGEKTFRILFEEEITAQGAITDHLFGQFLSIVRRYLEAQAKTLVPADRDAFAKGVHLEIIVKELPQYAFAIPDKFDRILRKVADFPYVLSHGDFNAANIFPTGVIDLEDSAPAPFGFDAVSAISTLDWFPDSPEFEYYARYRFTEAQRALYFSMCDEVAKAAGFPPVSAFAADFGFCRAIWSAVNMQAYPKLQAWRYDKFIKTYLFN